MSDPEVEQRSRLLAIKLRALVRSVIGDDADACTIEPFAKGAALVDASSAWILLDGADGATLGAPLAWAMRRGLELNIVTSHDAAVAARRAAGFGWPTSVWTEHDTSMVRATAVPHGASILATASQQRFMDRIEDAGAEPVLEHGVVSGEVRGLEVCRVVVDEHSGEERLEVGIGVHDREVFAMVHAGVPVDESLTKVVDQVRAHRVVGAPHHPFNMLAIERFARWRAASEPATLGLASLRPIEPPVPRNNLSDVVPCVGMGVGNDGTERLMVFVNGIDLDVVPFAVDAAAKYRCDGVSIVARGKDVTATMREMAASALVEVVFVEPGVAPDGALDGVPGGGSW